jgi:hypothetical protein
MACGRLNMLRGRRIEVFMKHIKTISVCVVMLALIILLPGAGLSQGRGTYEDPFWRRDIPVLTMDGVSFTLHIQEWIGPEATLTQLRGKVLLLDFCWSSSLAKTFLKVKKNCAAPE